MNQKILAIAVVAVIVIAGCAIVITSAGGDDTIRFDSSLEIFGNANGDSKLDSDDVSMIDRYVELKAKSDNSEIEKLGINLTFADANGDGKVDSADSKLVKDILDRKEGVKMKMLDGKRNPKTITIRDEYVLASDYTTNAELVNILGVVDQVVAVDKAIYLMKDFYMANCKNLNSLVNYGNQNSSTVSVDLCTQAGVNLWLCQTDSYTDIKANAVGEAIYLGLTQSLDGKPSESVCGQAILKAGYIFDKVQRAEEYVAWLDGIYDKIYDKTKDLKDSEKPRVLMTYYGHYMLNQSTKTIYAYTNSYLDAQAAELAGAKNIITDHTSDFTSFINLSLEKMADWEDDIDYVMVRTIYLSGSGGYTEGVPLNGYIIDDSSGLDSAGKYLSSLELLSGFNPDQFKLFCGYLTNDSTCGMLCAAYYAELFHPVLFSDFDADEVHQEYISKWMGIDYDLSKHGVFTNF